MFYYCDALILAYSSSIVKSLASKHDVSKVKFYKENAAFIVRNKGTLALSGKVPGGN